MVNITYGLLQAASQIVGPGDGYTIYPSGTDMIVTYDCVAEGCSVVAYDPGDSAFIMLCGALIFFMVPGVALLYSGLVRRKNALSLLLLCLLALAITAFQWFLWGYSLAFSSGGNAFLGDMKHVGFRGVMEVPIPQANNKIPAIVYAGYQGWFAALVPAVMIGAAAERGRVLPACIFIFCWVTLVYCPIARWVWAPEGWAFKLGVLDYAGGGPIEICSGFTGLVYSYYLGKRRGYGTTALSFRPHSVTHLYIGTVFLWVGWLGFNGGSTFAANLKAGLAILNTNLAASCAGLTWMALDWRLERKYSAVGFCTGAIVGLVAITPAAGYVGMPGALGVGIIASAVSNASTTLKGFLMVDDALDLLSVHGFAGIIGLICTALFAQSSITSLDGYSVGGGWPDHHWIQLGYQVAWICATAGWTVVISLILMVIIDHIPGCHFRAEEDDEIVGMDQAEAGEFAYDYVLIRRDVGDDDRSMHVHVRDDHDLPQDRANQQDSNKEGANGQVEQRFDQGQRHGADVEGDGNGFGGGGDGGSSAGEKTATETQVAPEGEMTQEK